MDVKKMACTIAGGVQAASFGVTAGLFLGRNISYFGPLAYQPMNVALVTGLPILALIFIGASKYKEDVAALLGSFVTIQIITDVAGYSSLPFIPALTALGIAYFGCMFTIGQADHKFEQKGSFIQGASFAVAGGYLAGRNITMLSSLMTNSVGAALVAGIPLLLTTIAEPKTFEGTYGLLGASFTAVQLTMTFLPAAAAFSLPLVPAVAAFALGCVGKDLIDGIFEVSY